MSSLNYKIELILHGKSLNALSKEREKLTHLYQDNTAGRGLMALSSENQRLAYLATRLPATYAVICKVLLEMIRRAGAVPEITSLLDVGAGPGTALLAAIDSALPLKTATMLERDPGFIGLGKQLCAEYAHLEQSWLLKEMSQMGEIAPHDLVIASYSLNELAEKERQEIAGKLWELALKFLIIIEPGTKSGFESLKKMRETLLLKGAHLLAPCPHSNQCPLSANDWCHFFARIERSSLHRKTKEAALNYEDEKFCYLIFSKTSYEPCHSRLLRHPFRGKGFVKLQLCSQTGLEQKTVTKSMKASYAQAKKLEWGDSFD
jgi:ribosomal protein RSM22 (predicted rRNA methylase)